MAFFLDIFLGLILRIDLARRWLQFATLLAPTRLPHCHLSHCLIAFGLIQKVLRIKSVPAVRHFFFNIFIELFSGLIAPNCSVQYFFFWYHLRIDSLIACSTNTVHQCYHLFLDMYPLSLSLLFFFSRQGRCRHTISVPLSVSSAAAHAAGSGQRALSSQVLQCVRIRAQFQYACTCLVE